MKMMNAKVSRIIAKGFAKFGKSFRKSNFGFPLLEKKIKMPIMESKNERRRGKIAGPGSVNLPMGSLIEREKTQTPTKRKNNPPARSSFMAAFSL
jgi:hypothetical protein